MVTYGKETWILDQRNKIKVNAVKIEYWRRSCPLTRMDKIKNEEMRMGMRIQKDILTTIAVEQLKWYEYVRRSRDSVRKPILDQLYETNFHHPPQGEGRFAGYEEVTQYQTFPIWKYRVKPLFNPWGRMSRSQRAKTVFLLNLPPIYIYSIVSYMYIIHKLDT